MSYAQLSNNLQIWISELFYSIKLIMKAVKNTF